MERRNGGSEINKCNNNNYRLKNNATYDKIHIPEHEALAVY